MNIQGPYAAGNMMRADAGDDGPQQGETMPLSDLLRIIQVRRRIIIATLLAVIAMTGVYLLVATPQYSADAVVMLDQRKNNVEDSSAVLSGLPTDTAAVQNQVQILTSKELIGRVVDKGHLLEDPEFNGHRSLIATLGAALNPLHWFAGMPAEPVMDQEVRRNRVISAILKRLQASPIGLSTAIDIRFTSPDAKKAAAMTNMIADAYVEDQLEAKFQATQKATDWLSGRISDLSRQSQAAEAAVQRFKAEHNITTDAKGVTVVDQQISDLNQRLILAKTDLAEKEANYGRLAQLAKAGEAANAPQVVQSQLITTLRTQESELTRKMADLSSKYGPRHPKMLDLQAQKANLDSKINDEIHRIVQAVKSDAQSARDRVNSLQNSLHGLEQQNVGENKVSVRLKALQAEASSSRAMYEAFLGRLNQTQNQQGIQTPDARIITRAEVPSAPSAPQKKKLLLLAVFFGLAIGMGLAMLAEKLDAGFRTSEQVAGELQLPVLATIPEVGHAPISEPFPGHFLNRIWKLAVQKFAHPPAPLGAADICRHGLDKPMSSYAEALRGLELGITLSDVDAPPRILMLTSSIASEGKSTLALSLARTLSQSGKRVVLVDCDLRRPVQMKLFGLPGSKAGISEILAGRVPLEDGLIKDDLSPVMLLSCIRPAPHPMQMLSSRAFQDMLHRLHDMFDFVLLDTSPVLPVHDSRLLSSYADAVVFVVRWEETPRQVAAKAIETLRQGQAPLAGVVLTRADAKQYHYYSYGYKSYSSYSHYSRYYSE